MYEAELILFTRSCFVFHLSKLVIVVITVLLILLYMFGCVTVIGNKVGTGLFPCCRV